MSGFVTVAVRWRTMFGEVVASTKSPYNPYTSTTKLTRLQENIGAAEIELR